MKFLQDESERIRSKLTKNTEVNVLQKVKKTKFGIEKYNEKDYLNKIELNSTNFLITNFQWLKYSNNSCRYDVFTTLYIFFLYDFIDERLKKFNLHIQNIHNLMKEIRYDPINNSINRLWDYCIKNKIDIERTEINNVNNIVESGFGSNDIIVQLFSIFKNEEDFCILEKRQRNMPDL